MSQRIVHVSPHLLMDVMSCDTKAWVRHVQGYTSKGEAIKAIAGQAFHTATETLFDPESTLDRPARVQAAVAGFHATYDAPFARLSAEKLEPSLTPHNLERVLRRWIEMHPAALLPWKRVLLVEEAFVVAEWVFPDPYGQPGDTVLVQLIVRPDIVVEGIDDRVRWVDTKTTGWHITDSTWRQALRLSLQAQMYSAGVVTRFGEKAIYAGWFSAIELRKLPDDPNRTCATHKVKYVECGNEHAKAEFIECLTTAERCARALADGKVAAERFVWLAGQPQPEPVGMQGTANGTCRFCSAAGWCEANRPTGVEKSVEMTKAALESFFIYDPWPIEAGKRERKA